MTTTPSPGERAALAVGTYAELVKLIEAGELMPDRLDTMPTRLRLAESAVRLAAAAGPARTLDDLSRAEFGAWLHDPTLYRRALTDRGPAEVRRLMHAVAPAAALYADVTNPHIAIRRGPAT